MNRRQFFQLTAGAVISAEILPAEAVIRPIYGPSPLQGSFQLLQLLKKYGIVTFRSLGMETSWSIREEFQSPQVQTPHNSA